MTTSLTSKDEHYLSLLKGDHFHHTEDKMVTYFPGKDTFCRYPKRPTLFEKEWRPFSLKEELVVSPLGTAIPLPMNGKII